MAYRKLCALSIALTLTVACGEESNPPIFTGTGGGGSAGSGGSGGEFVPPEPQRPCAVNPLCQACPTEALCDSDGDCAEGFTCIESGCTDLEDGTAIRQCVFAGGGACDDDSFCSDGRQCIEVEGEGKRCIKTTPGCNATRDCVTGFECEQGTCVDRRLPCVLDEHCPKNHVCFGQTNSTFCLRMHVDCLQDFDCVGRAPYCADVDGDGSTECSGSIEPNPASGACTNDLCGDSGSPVCEATSTGSVSQCGRYGLCEGDVDCASGFGCALLWPDGRRECVPMGGTCSSFADCPPGQACAAPRAGGPAACQVGTLDGVE